MMPDSAALIASLIQSADPLDDGALALIDELVALDEAPAPPSQYARRAEPVSPPEPLPAPSSAVHVHLPAVSPETDAVHADMLRYAWEVRGDVVRYARDEDEEALQYAAGDWEQDRTTNPRTGKPFSEHRYKNIHTQQVKYFTTPPGQGRQQAQPGEEKPAARPQKPASPLDALPGKHKQLAKEWLKLNAADVTPEHEQRYTSALAGMGKDELLAMRDALGIKPSQARSNAGQATLVGKLKDWALHWQDRGGQKWEAPTVDSAHEAVISGDDQWAAWSLSRLNRDQLRDLRGKLQQAGYEVGAGGRSKGEVAGKIKAAAEAKKGGQWDDSQEQKFQGVEGQRQKEFEEAGKQAGQPPQAEEAASGQGAGDAVPEPPAEPGQAPAPQSEAVPASDADRAAQKRGFRSAEVEKRQVDAAKIKKNLAQSGAGLAKGTVEPEVPEVPSEGTYRQLAVSEGQPETGSQPQVDAQTPAGSPAAPSPSPSYGDMGRWAKGRGLSPEAEQHATEFLGEATALSDDEVQEELEDRRQQQGRQGARPGLGAEIDGLEHIARERRVHAGVQKAIAAGEQPLNPKSLAPGSTITSHFIPERPEPMTVTRADSDGKVWARYKADPYHEHTIGTDNLGHYTQPAVAGAKEEAAATGQTQAGETPAPQAATPEPALEVSSTTPEASAAAPEAAKPAAESQTPPEAPEAATGEPGRAADKKTPPAEPAPGTSPQLAGSSTQPGQVVTPKPETASASGAEEAKPGAVEAEHRNRIIAAMHGKDAETFEGQGQVMTGIGLVRAMKKQGMDKVQVEQVLNQMVEDGSIHIARHNNPGILSQADRDDLPTVAGVPTTDVILRPGQASPPAGETTAPAAPEAGSESQPATVKPKQPRKPKASTPGEADAREAAKQAGAENLHGSPAAMKAAVNGVPDVGPMAGDYATLGLRSGAQLADVDRAFRKLAAKYHPDRNPGDTEAEERYKAISDAYERIRKSAQADGGRPVPEPVRVRKPVSGGTVSAGTVKDVAERLKYLYRGQRHTPLKRSDILKELDGMGLANLDMDQMRQLADAMEIHWPQSALDFTARTAPGRAWMDAQDLIKGSIAKRYWSDDPAERPPAGWSREYLYGEDYRNPPGAKGAPAAAKPNRPAKTPKKATSPGSREAGNAAQEGQQQEGPAGERPRGGQGGAPGEGGGGGQLPGQAAGGGEEGGKEEVAAGGKAPAAPVAGKPSGPYVEPGRQFTGNIKGAAGPVGDPQTISETSKLEELFQNTDDEGRRQLQEHFGIKVEPSGDPSEDAAQFQGELEQALHRHYNPPIPDRLAGKGGEKSRRAVSELAALGDRFRSAASMTSTWNEKREGLLKAMSAIRTADGVELSPSTFGRVERALKEQSRLGGTAEARQKAAADLKAAKQYQEKWGDHQRGWAAVGSHDEKTVAERHQAVNAALRKNVTRPEKLSVARYEGMDEKLAGHMDQGIRALEGVVQAGARPLREVGTYKATNEDGSAVLRAHYDPGKHTINWQSGHNDSGVAIHEMMHAVETNDPLVWEACKEFYEYRVGGEKPVKLKDALPDRGYADDEVGVKDHFDRAFGDDGWYVGKDYGSLGNTELLSMGVELLFNDPVGFAERDPEYCAFVAGILDGSFRNKKVPLK